MNHNIAIRKSTNAFGAKKTTSDLQTVVSVGERLNEVNRTRGKSVCV